MRTTILSAALVLLASGSASAQTKAFVLLSTPCQFGNCDPTYVLEVDVEARRSVALTQIEHAPPGAANAALSGDGRYLVWTGAINAGFPAFLSIFDIVTHTTLASTRLAPEAPPKIVTHPVKSRAFFVQGSDVVRLEPAGEHRFPAGCTTHFPDFLALAGDGTRLFVFCLTSLFPFPVGETRVLDSETGAAIATVANTSHLQAANLTGAELYTVDPHSASPGTLVRYDIATGTELSRQPLPVGAFPATLSIDPRTGRLYVTTTTGSSPDATGGVIVYDGTTLDLVAQLSTPVPPTLSFSNAAPLGIVTLPMRDAVDGQWARLVLLDTDSFAVIASADLPPGVVPAGTLIGQAPPRPVDLAATVSGDQVTIRWSPGSGGGSATTYTIEAGLAAGQTIAVASLPTATSTVTVPNVPPGTYYVRVRASNFAARSAASDELQIVVPTLTPCPLDTPSNGCVR